MTEEILDGAIEIYSEEDYCAGELNIENPRHKFKEFKVQFNQDEINKTGCVYHAGYGSFIDNLGEVRNYKDDLLKLDSMKEQYGYIQGSGMYVYRGVDMLRNYWNTNNPDDEIITYRTEMGSEEFFKFIDMGYSVHTGYKGNAKYNEDRRDGVLNGNEFGKFTYGHSIRLTEEGKLEVVDNYYGKIINNIYEVKDIKGLVKNGVFFKYGYIYIFKKHIMTQLEKDIADIQYLIDNGLSFDTQMLEDIKKGNYTPKIQSTLLSIRIAKHFNNK